MKVKTEDLKKAYHIVAHVPANAGATSSLFVQLQAGASLTLALTGIPSAIAGVKLERQEQWRFFIDRRVLSAFLGSATAETTSIQKQEQELILRCGKHQLKVQAMEAISGYIIPQPRMMKTITIQKSLHGPIKALSRYTPDRPAKENLQAVYLVRGWGIVASSDVVAAAYLDKTVGTTAPLPPLLAGLICDEAKVLIDRTGVLLQFPNGRVYQTVNESCQRQYPLQALSKIIATTVEAKATGHIAAASILQALQNIQKLSFAFKGETMFVGVAGDKGAKLLKLHMELVQGQTDWQVPAQLLGNVAGHWPLVPFLAWVTYVNRGDPKAVINYVRFDHYHGFRVTAGKQQHVLVMVEGKG